MKGLIACIVILASFVTMAYGCSALSKNINYHLFYESKVEQTIREMVNQDALRDR